MYDDIKNSLVSTFKVPADEIHPGATLEELGLDSLDVVEFAALIKDLLNADVTEDELAELTRLDAIVDLVQTRVQSPVTGA
jgi:acyl carrier protein